jgi:cytochrome bd-type quinol oxidase subunit 2
MSYEVYKVLHLLGILTLFCALGGAVVLAFTGTADEQPRARKLLMILHGIALVVIVVAGFGLMARKGIVHGSGWPSWIYGKFAIWLVLGAAAAFVRRSGRKALSWIIVLPLVGALAAWLAVVQPG